MVAMIDQSEKRFEEVPWDGFPLSPLSSENEREEKQGYYSSFQRASH